MCIYLRVNDCFSMMFCYSKFLISFDKNLFFHPKILAQNIIKEIDNLEGDLYETFGRLQLCLPKNIIEIFPYFEEREKLVNYIWDIFYTLKTYEIIRHTFSYQDCKYLLTSHKKEWELEIKVYIDLWEGESENTLIRPFYTQFDDPELLDMLNHNKCNIVQFPKNK